MSGDCISAKDQAFWCQEKARQEKLYAATVAEETLLILALEESMQRERLVQRCHHERALVRLGESLTRADQSHCVTTPRKSPSRSYAHIESDEEPSLPLDMLDCLTEEDVERIWQKERRKLEAKIALMANRVRSLQEQRLHTAFSTYSHLLCRTGMVKKTDTYVRVLRPGESMTLGRKFAEFEIVLFRPRRHIHSDNARDTPRSSELDTAAADRGGYSRETGTNQASASSPGAGNKVRFAIGAGPVDGAHGDKKKGGNSSPTPHILNGASRDNNVDAATEDGGAAGGRGRGESGMGNETRLADAAVDAPLFFDTTVCIFYDELTKMDYVATGRTTADSKGIHYIPHLVVLGDEMATGAFCNYNITRPDGESLVDESDDAFGDDDGVLVSRSALNNGPITMGAADGVTVNLRRLGTSAGFLVCGTLFGKGTYLNLERNLFYMVRKPKSPLPLCLVPLCVCGEPSKSCVSLMARKIKVHGDVVWELVNVNEGLPLQDVKSLVLKLQERGLRDPAHFTRDFEVRSVTSRPNEGTAGGGEDDEVFTSSGESSSSEMELSRSQTRLDEALVQKRGSDSVAALFFNGRRSPAGQSRNERTFSALLADVPRVTREGRRQYNVGRSHVQTNLFDCDTSEEDEVLDDAMRAVVPCYANASLVRYDNGAYNVGSKVDNLVTHYVGHRETYGLDAAEHRSTSAAKNVTLRGQFLPFLGSQRGRLSTDWGAPVPVLDRCQIEEDITPGMRPELPADLLVTSQDRLLAAASLQQHRLSVNGGMKKRHSTTGRGGRSSSLRPATTRKGAGRAAPAAAAGKKDAQVKKRKEGDEKRPNKKPADTAGVAKAGVAH